MKRKTIKSILSIFIGLAIFQTAQPCFSLSLNEIAQKRKATRAKIHKLKILETQETNKMLRNQQKLEKNERALQNSQHQFTKTQNRLENLEYQ
jgi:AraC-like DNA-binding protein